MSSAISVRDLRKTYGSTVALDGLTMDVPAGQIAGLVGPDGAGKSTAVRVLSTALAPTSGAVAIAGHDIRTEVEQVRQLVGVVPQSFSLYGDLTVVENLDFLANVYGLPLSSARATYPELLALARLTGHERELAGNLSGGMKRKLAVVCSLVHHPRVLLLDEPTAGVDPVSRRELWKMISDLVSGGLSVLLTTAYMDEAERCRQVAFLHAGRVIASGSPDELRALVREQIIQVTGAGIARALSAVRTLPGVSNARVMGNQLRASTTNADGSCLNRIVQAATGAGLADASARVVAPSMEDVFMSLRDAGSARPL